jgi:hypothetical protein
MALGVLNSSEGASDGVERECCLLVQFSNLYTAVDRPAMTES